MSDEEKKDALVKRETNHIIPIIPRNYEEIFKMGKMMAATDMVPKDFKGKEANTIVAIQLGLEVGLLPMQAIQNIAVINGRPCIWGDAQLALVRGSGHLEWMKEAGDNDYATCEVKRYGDPNKVSQTFTKADAQRAGLWEKTDPWKKYPKRMLQMRARSFALRDLFPDVLKGISSREEMQDVIDVESIEVIEVKKVDVTTTKLKTDNLDALKKDEGPAEGKTETLTEPEKTKLGIADENAEPPDDLDDIPTEEIPDETELIDEKEVSAFLAKARELQIPTAKIISFVKKNGFSEATKITKDKYPGMMDGLDHLKK